MTGYSLLGFIAVLLWSTNIGFSRILIESIGGFFTSGLGMIISGILLLLFFILKFKSIRLVFELPKRYIAICGSMFTANILFFYLAMHLCENRSELLMVSTLNYLWPVLTIALGIPILGKKCRPFPFILGIILTIIGTFGISLREIVFSPEQQSMKALFAYLSALLGAIFWALYSCYSIKYLSNTSYKMDALPIFMLISGLEMTTIGLIVTPNPKFSHTLIPAALYTFLLPGTLAYFFWNIGIEKGNEEAVTYSSLFIVVLSTLASSFLLKIDLSIDMLIYCLIISAGAIVCKTSEKHN